jgi:hypothetical protein
MMILDSSPDVSAVPMPRMLKDSPSTRSLPITATPGMASNTSPTLSGWSRSMSSWSIEVTAWGVSMAILSTPAPTMRRCSSVTRPCFSSSFVWASWAFAGPIPTNAVIAAPLISAAQFLAASPMSQLLVCIFRCGLAWRLLAFFIDPGSF